MSSNRNGHIKNAVLKKLKSAQKCLESAEVSIRDARKKCKTTRKKIHSCRKLVNKIGGTDHDKQGNHQGNDSQEVEDIADEEEVEDEEGDREVNQDQRIGRRYQGHTQKQSLKHKRDHSPSPVAVRQNKKARNTASSTPTSVSARGDMHPNTQQESTNHPQLQESGNHRSSNEGERQLIVLESDGDSDEVSENTNDREAGIKKPKGLKTGGRHPKEMSYFHAALQCFAVVLDPVKLEADLGDDHVGIHTPRKETYDAEDIRDEAGVIIRDKGKRSNTSQTDVYIDGLKENERPSPVAEFLDTLRWMQTLDKEWMYAYRLFKLFGFATKGYEGEDQKDPAVFVTDMLDRLAVGHTYKKANKQQYTLANRIMDPIFRVREHCLLKCTNCGDSWSLTVASEPEDTGNRRWLLSVAINKKTESISEALQNPEPRVVEVKCRKCKNAICNKTWLGLLDPAPEVLIVRLCRVSITDDGKKKGKRKAGQSIECNIKIGMKLTMNVVISEKDSNTDSKGDENSAAELVTYALQGIVKQEKSGINEGRFIAYTKWTKAGKIQWYKCNEIKAEDKVQGENVTWKTACATGGEHDEQPCLLFYKRKHRSKRDNESKLGEMGVNDGSASEEGNGMENEEGEEDEDETEWRT
jgi:hypothetical protein